MQKIKIASILMMGSLLLLSCDDGGQSEKKCDSTFKSKCASESEREICKNGIVVRDACPNNGVCELNNNVAVCKVKTKCEVGCAGSVATSCPNGENGAPLTATCQSSAHCDRTTGTCKGVEPTKCKVGCDGNVGISCPGGESGAEAKTVCVNSKACDSATGLCKCTIGCDGATAKRCGNEGEPITEKCPDAESCDPRTGTCKADSSACQIVGEVRCANSEQGFLLGVEACVEKDGAKKWERVGVQLACHGLQAYHCDGNPQNAGDTLTAESTKPAVKYEEACGNGEQCFIGKEEDDEGKVFIYPACSKECNPEVDYMLCDNGMISFCDGEEANTNKNFRQRYFMRGGCLNGTRVYCEGNASGAIQKEDCAPKTCKTSEKTEMFNGQGVSVLHSACVEAVRCETLNALQCNDRGVIEKCTQKGTNKTWEEIGQKLCTEDNLKQLSCQGVAAGQAPKAEACEGNNKICAYDFSSKNEFIGAYCVKESADCTANKATCAGQVNTLCKKFYKDLNREVGVKATLEQRCPDNLACHTVAICAAKPASKACTGADNTILPGSICSDENYAVALCKGGQEEYHERLCVKSGTEDVLISPSACKLTKGNPFACSRTGGECEGTVCKYPTPCKDGKAGWCDGNDLYLCLGIFSGFSGALKRGCGAKRCEEKGDMADCVE